ncbi:MAG: D-alanyl-D-alanine carboxypeptidase/D-alanyl-D-alanine-endopeptidase [Desulfomonile sp.]|nr:D-alanyl-D-alanine carboxypeptidase/D-alanyl-D-alanine-endopeptidase [Desulfomonile sp.]
MLKLILENPPLQRAHLLAFRRTRCGRLFACAATIVLLLLAVCTPFSAFAAASPELNRLLDEVIRRELPSTFAISLLVADARTGAVLLEKNPDLPLVPASTMKIVTSWAALTALKPDFTFVTEVLVDNLRGSTARNIYLKGSGDPYLVSEQLFALAREVRDSGLKEIRGDVIVDDTYFIPDKPLDEQEELGTRSYHAPYGALSLNFNSMRITVHPGSRPGEPARVLADPQSEYASLKSAVETVEGRRGAELSIQKECTQTGRDIIRVTGQIGVKAPSKSRYVNVSTPSLYTGEVFKEFLLREGIRVFGKVIRGRVPANATLYVKFRSPPLAVVTYWLNKFSNNFIAEQLSLALGAAVYGPPGTREKGLSVIQKGLLELGIDEGLFTLSEASGLSRQNRLSASVLVRVLLAAAADFSCSGEFVSSLGIAGADGTLKDKFTDPSVKRRIRAKTGNLRGVNALAGYGLSLDGRMVAFAVIVNSLKNGTSFVDHGEKIMRSVLDMPLAAR